VSRGLRSDVLFVAHEAGMSLVFIELGAVIIDLAILARLAHRLGLECTGDQLRANLRSEGRPGGPVVELSAGCSGGHMANTLRLERVMVLRHRHRLPSAWPRCSN
jgi:hypothetical protein